MNYLFQAQFVAKMKLSEEAFRDSIALPLSILDDVSGICGHKAHKPKYYRPGELIDAPETWACRWQAVIRIGDARHQALLSLMKSVQLLLDSQLPSCTLQWKVESLGFLCS